MSYTDEMHTEVLTSNQRVVTTTFLHDAETAAWLFLRASLREAEIVRGHSYAALSGQENVLRNVVAFSWRAGALARRTVGEPHLALARAYMDATTSRVSNDSIILCWNPRRFPCQRSNDALDPAGLNCVYSLPRSSCSYV